MRVLTADAPRRPLIAVIALLIVMLLYFKRESHAPFYATALLLVLNQLFSRHRWGWSDAVAFLEAFPAFEGHTALHSERDLANVVAKEIGGRARAAS